MMWPDSEETQELLAQARDGDTDARNQLLERHREGLRRMIGLRLDKGVQRRVDASDVVQDVLVEANRRLTDYLSKAGMPFHVWLRHLARDRLIDAHRRHRGAARRSVDREQKLGGPGIDDASAADLAALLLDRQMTPAAAATHHELERRFAAALETLDEIDREIILMRHFEQLSNQQAAQALDLTEPAAGMRYLRALRRLRALFDEPTKEEPSS
ncbi:MAG TPA: sigma-70 family RNA polymerase sigma factor [Pirellulales bacterium]|jgi:RNA polymerase sigma-70 factor (ECF subfamily)